MNGVDVTENGFCLPTLPPPIPGELAGRCGGKYVHQSPYLRMTPHSVDISGVN